MANRTIRRIVGGLSGTISTGSWENLKPNFLIEEIIEDCQMTDEQVVARTRELYEKCFTLMKEAETKATIERIERERAGIKFYTHPDTGQTLPSVTSVINWDADFFVPAHELQQYASQSQIVHAQVEHFITTGKWAEPKEIQEVWADIVIVTKGNLKLPIESGYFPAFLEKYPIKGIINGFSVYLSDCAGTFDFEGAPEFKESLPIHTIFDVKRTPDRIKDGKQLSAYCKAKGYRQGIIVPLNDKTAQGFSKPIIYDEKTLEGFYMMFRKDRTDFNHRYGV